MARECAVCAGTAGFVGDLVVLGDAVLGDAVLGDGRLCPCGRNWKVWRSRAPRGLEGAVWRLWEEEAEEDWGFASSIVLVLVVEVGGVVGRRRGDARALELYT